MGERQTEREPTEAELVQFRAAAKLLNELGRAGLHLYLGSGMLYLLTGPSHEGGGRARHDRVRESRLMTNMDGGDW